MKTLTEKLLIILFFSGTFLSLTNCNDFLEEKEVPRPTIDFYATPQGVESAATAVYGYMRWGASGLRHDALNVYGTDLFTDGGETRNEFNRFTSALNPDHGTTYSLWESHYKGIATCNLVINNVGKGEMSEAEKNAAIAEMCFMRGYFYFDLVQQFGKIPLVLDVVFEAKTDYKRAPVADVYNQIIEDLTFATKYLRESTSSSEKNVGKATRYAAMHLLSKVYLARCSAVTEERGQKPTDADSALVYAEMVINSGKYALLKDYAELWDINNTINEEIIFSVQYTEELMYNGAGNKTHTHFQSMYEDLPGMKRDVANGRPFMYIKPSERVFFGLYDRKNDSRLYKSFKWVYYVNNPGTNYIEGDTAVYYSLVNPKPSGRLRYTYFLYDGTNNARNNRYYPTLVKHTDPNLPKTTEQAGSRNWIRMRLGETYLLAAEAAGRKGDLQTAVKYINKVRERAAWQEGETKYPQYWQEEGGEYGSLASTFDEIRMDEATLGSVDFVEFILDERARELLGEWFRWEDLVRCEKFYEYAIKYNPEAAENVKPYHKLRPIPQKHIDLIVPKGPIEEEQNEGYY